MDATDVLLIVLIAAGIAVCGVALFVMLRAMRTLDETRRFIERVDERLIPLLEKADVTVDAMNAELLRVDGIVTEIEDASGRVTTTARAVQDVVGTPMRIVAGAGEGISRFFSSSRRRHRA